VPGAGDPQLTTPGVPRADVWVFDAADPGAALGGTPLRILALFGDTPRALAASPDGSRVYAAVFHSGNRSTAISEGGVCNGFQPSTPCAIAGTTVPGGVGPPAVNFAGQSAPEVGVIVQKDDAGAWRDDLGRDWSAALRFDLPDRDVFEIDAETLAEVRSFPGVGTILFNVAVNPANGKVYVSNLESRNRTRFEGPGTTGGSTVQGHLAETRITILSPAQTLRRHLNKHIDYGTLAGAPGFDPSARDHSLSTPLEIAFSADGATAYVAAFGSDRVGVFPTAALENDSFDPATLSAGYLPVSGGPAGIAIDEARGRLYVATRFDNAVAVIDLATRSELRRHALHNPEPAHVVAGRRFLYDARFSSANGEASCASCHIFGDFDSLAWDLGNPDDPVTANPIPNLIAPTEPFHPLKGPMTTQTLRGLAGSGAMHWRGDRANGAFGTSAFDEALSFNNFIVAFEGLLGRASEPGHADMQKFTDFALEIVLPPNPVRSLDNRLTANEQTGEDFYFGPVSDSVFNCNGCHTLDPANGFFGTDGHMTFENEPQHFKVPHLRNAYQKVGMFGMMDVPFVGGSDHGHKGDQVRGFGYLHDGSIDTLFRFFQATVFQFPGGDALRRQVESFVLAFDTDLAPIVGQQVTLSATNLAAVSARIDLLLARAAAPFASALLGGVSRECDVVVKGAIGGEPRGWLYESASAQFRPDRAGEPLVAKSALLALAGQPGQELTFTAAPTGSGRRMGIDRDLDTVLDGDDNCPAAANPGQEDEDGNDVGDACDPLFVPEPDAGAALLAALGALLGIRRMRSTARA
jgi:DNA-binding beta-propeller fold protein YncE